MNPKRGELYRLKSDAVGKRRVVVIVSRNELNGGHSVLAVPFYSQQLEKRRDQSWCSLFYQGEGGLDVDCVAKTDQIAVIDKREIDLATGPIGKFDESQLERLFAALKWTLKID